jgi:HNH endonuclease.
MEYGKCQLCGLEEKLEKHHLIPVRECRGKNSKKKNDPENHIYVCGTCHRTIHAYFSDGELRKRLNTIESLRNDQKFSSFVEWRRKHPCFSTNSTKMSDSKRKS